jgi:hypothetical protein
MLAYYLEWHMRHCLALMLFADADKKEAGNPAQQRGGQGAACPAIAAGHLIPHFRHSPS